MTTAIYYFEKCRDLGRAVHIRHFLLKSLRKAELREAWQRKQWTRLLGHAKEHSAFYAKHLAGITAQTPLKEIPTLTKTDILENFDALITTQNLSLQTALDHLDALQHDAYLHHRFKIFRSGGSSGNPGIMVYSPREFATVLSQILRSSQGVVSPPKTRRLRGANIYASTPTHDSIRISQSFQIGCHQVEDFSAEIPSRNLVGPLNDFRPDVLSGYPSKILDLAFLKMDGELTIQPQAIFLGSEPVTPRMRRVILQAFGILPHDHYGTTEAIVMATECRLHRGLHLEDDLHFIEILNQDGTPTLPGQLGQKIYVTNLTAFTQPIIRYELSDLMLLHDDFHTPCPCGHPGRLIQRIVGRSEDTFAFNTGNAKTVFLSPRVFQDFMEVFGEVRQFQILKKADSLTLKICTAPHLSTAETSALHQRIQNGLQALLQKNGILGPPIAIDQVSEFHGNPQASQKFKQVWNQSA